MKTVVFDYPSTAWPAEPVHRCAPYLEPLGWELVAECDRPDVALIHQDSLEQWLPKNIPLIVLERCDGCRITGITRKHISDRRVRVVLKNSCYADLDIYNRTTGRAFAEPDRRPETKLSGFDLGKIRLGVSYAATRRIQDLAPDVNSFKTGRPLKASFAGTIAYQETESITHHREACCAALGKIPGCTVIRGRNLPDAEYWALLADSTACVSPCGCGEVCWRCYQAWLAGCALIRPALGYEVATPEDIYRYAVFCRQDWGDLADTINGLNRLEWLTPDVPKWVARRIRLMNTPKSIAKRLSHFLEEAAA